MNSKKSLILMASLAALPAMAQSDFGIWTEAAIEKSLGKQFSVDASVEFRSEDNLNRASRWAGSVGVSYKPFKFLSFGAGYVFIHDYTATESKTIYEKDEFGNIEYDDFGNPEIKGFNVDRGFWRNKHRISLDATGKVNFGRFTFSVRERYQYTYYNSATTVRYRYRDELPEGMSPESWTGNLYPYAGHNFTELKQVDRYKNSKDKHYLRSRFELEYNINNVPLTPYISYEFTNDLCEKMNLEKTRLIVGAEWKVSKQHRIDFGYLYEDPNDHGESYNHHAIKIGYKFKF